MKHISPMEVVFFRSVFSLVYCYFHLRAIKVNPLGNNRRVLLLRGLSGVTALFMFFLTLRKLEMVLSITIQYLSPVFTSILGIYFLKERVKPLQWLFFAISMYGVWKINEASLSGDSVMILLGVISAVFSGVAYNCVKYLKRSEHHMVVILYFPLVATPVAGLALLTNEFVLPNEWSMISWTTPQGMDWLYLLIIGIFSQLAQVFMTKGIQSERVAVATSVKYLGSILALTIGYFWFDEMPKATALIGVVLIICGVLSNVLIKKTPAVAK